LLGLIAATASCAQPLPAGPADPAARAVDYLKRAQKPDGAFTSGALPDEVSTAFVLGLLSSSELAGSGIDDVLNRAAGFLVAKQREDGSFGDPLVSGVCVMALSTYGRRLKGIREPEAVGVEVFERALTGQGDRALDGQRADGGWSARESGRSDAVETAFRLRLLRLAQKAWAV
jgi:hypothetical protein